MGQSTKVVALDIHRDSITVAVADPDRQEPRLYGTMASTDEAVAHLADQLADPARPLRFFFNHLHPVDVSRCSSSDFAVSPRIVITGVIFHDPSEAIERHLRQDREPPGSLRRRPGGYGLSLLVKSTSTGRLSWSQRIRTDTPAMSVSGPIR